MATDFENLQAELQEATKGIKSAVEKRDEELKSLGEVTEKTAKQLEQATSRLDELKGAVEAAETERKGMDERMIELEKSVKRGALAGDYLEASKSYGQLFVESEEYKHAASRGARSTQPVTVNKDISSLPNSAGALIRPDRRPDVIIDPDRPRFIRELLNTIPTSSNAVEVMRQNVFTNNAAPQGVGESSAYEFEKKPESNITYELVTVPIRTMAHWVPASRQVLADAPMLQRMIDGRLMYGLNLLGDAQLLYGDGTGQNLTGLMVDSDVSDIGEIATGTSSDDLPGAMIDHIRTAVTELQKNEFYNVNGVVMNPVDWQTIETAKGTDGHYIWVNVPNGGEPRLWRVPVIVTNAINEGEFILGDWSMGATIYTRETMDIRVAEQHEEFFVKNAVAILAEERYGFGIELPKAFAKGQFTVAAE